MSKDSVLKTIIICNKHDWEHIIQLDKQQAQILELGTLERFFMDDFDLALNLRQLPKLQILDLQNALFNIKKLSICSAQLQKIIFCTQSQSDNLKILQIRVRQIQLLEFFNQNEQHITIYPEIIRFYSQYNAHAIINSLSISFDKIRLLLFDGVSGDTFLEALFKQHNLNGITISLLNQTTKNDSTIEFLKTLNCISYYHILGDNLTYIIKIIQNSEAITGKLLPLNNNEQILNQHQDSQATISNSTFYDINNNIYNQLVEQQYEYNKKQTNTDEVVNKLELSQQNIHQNGQEYKQDLTLMSTQKDIDIKQIKSSHKQTFNSIPQNNEIPITTQLDNNEDQLQQQQNYINYSSVISSTSQHQSISDHDIELNINQISIETQQCVINTANNQIIQSTDIRLNQNKISEKSDDQYCIQDKSNSQYNPQLNIQSEGQLDGSDSQLDQKTQGIIDNAANQPDQFEIQNQSSDIKSKQLNDSTISNVKQTNNSRVTFADPLVEQSQNVDQNVVNKQLSSKKQTDPQNFQPLFVNDSIYTAGTTSFSEDFNQACVFYMETEYKTEDNIMQTSEVNLSPIGIQVGEMECLSDEARNFRQDCLSGDTKQPPAGQFHSFKQEYLTDNLPPMQMLSFNCTDKNVSEIMLNNEIPATVDNVDCLIQNFQETQFSDNLQSQKLQTSSNSTVDSNESKILQNKISNGTENAILNNEKEQKENISKLQNQYETINKKIKEQNKEKLIEIIENIAEQANQAKNYYEMLSYGYKKLLSEINDKVKSTTQYQNNNEMNELYELNKYLQWYCEALVGGGVSAQLEDAA